jgi:diaminopimelate decarboxylase
MAIMTSGAYGFSMASNYNSRPRVAEVMVKEDQYYVIRARETYEDLVRGEMIPDFLQ